MAVTGEAALESSPRKPGGPVTQQLERGAKAEVDPEFVKCSPCLLSEYPAKMEGRYTQVACQIVETLTPVEIARQRRLSAFNKIGLRFVISDSLPGGIVVSPRNDVRHNPDDRFFRIERIYVALLELSEKRSLEEVKGAID